MDGCYYPMDAFHFLVLFVVSGMAAFCIECLPVLFVGDMQMALSPTRLWGSLANPPWWIQLRDAQMQQLGSLTTAMWYEV